MKQPSLMGGRSRSDWSVGSGRAEQFEKVDFKMGELRAAWGHTEPRQGPGAKMAHPKQRFYNPGLLSLA